MSEVAPPSSETNSAYSEEVMSKLSRLSSKLVKQQGKNEKQSEPRFGDHFIVSARQLHRALVTACEREYERSLYSPEQCDVFMSALREIHRSFAKIHKEEKEFMALNDFLLNLVFVGAANESVTIDIPELLARVSISTEDFALLWKSSKPYRERMKAEEERAKRELPNGQRLFRIDPAFMNPANFN